MGISHVAPSRLSLNSSAAMVSSSFIWVFSRASLFSEKQARKTRRPLLDRIANALLPSVARLQPVDVPPVRDPGGLQHLAHLVYPVRVLANVRNEYVLPTSVIHDRGV